MPEHAGAHAFPIVAIGASAGGLEAFQTFLDAMPSDCGMAIVLISHLDPTHESHLPELLGRRTEMPVEQAVSGIAVQPNRVYVIPPNATLTIQGEVLQVSAPEQPRGLRAPIDAFFSSLAKDVGPRAICIVLSGTGSDGSIGLRAVKEYGGIAIAQCMETARYDGMPRSAVGTGYVDFELPIESMPRRLLQHTAHLRELEATSIPAEFEDLGNDTLAHVLSIIRSRTGHDFRGYKKSTIMRRIQRRMNLAQHSEMDAYLQFLKSDPGEAVRLFKDLLIGVTRFFRDTEVYELLRTRVIPDLLRERSLDRRIRVWVPGCSTGEEAYSIAILLIEGAEERGIQDPKIQIFATDIDDAAIELARSGTFPESCVEALSEKRLGRFFERRDGGWRANKMLRERVLFAVHDVIRDAPFSRLDMISCRNLLIYLDSAMQKKILPVFHYALRPQGWLVLGPSEGTSGAEKHFEPVSRRNRIFRARERSSTRSEPPPVSRGGPSRTADFVATERALAGQTATRMIERLLIDSFAPACAVVSADDRALYFTGSTAPYLEMPRGSATLNIFELSRPGVTMELRRLLRDAGQSGGEAQGRELRIRHDGGYRRVRIRVVPIEARLMDGGLRLVVFEEIEEPQRADTGVESAPETQAVRAEDDVSHLEEELAITQQTLETTVEELETSNEELRSANEEFMSTNEELQSTVEELETSKEELQSMNEELETVNAELRSKVEEIDRSNSDLQNLLESTHIATLFLDRDLRIRGFTPALQDLFRLIDADRGRPVGDLARRFDHPNFEQEVRAVVRNEIPFRGQVTTSDARSFTMRIFPYRTLDELADGAVVTFNETTSLVQAHGEVAALNRRLQFRLEELELMLELVPTGVLICEDPGTLELRFNRCAASLCGVMNGQTVALREEDALPFRFLAGGRHLASGEMPIARVLRTGEPEPARELTVVRADGSRREVRYSAAPLAGDGGEIRGAIASLEDITDEKRREREMAASAQRQEMIVSLGLVALAERDVERIRHEVVSCIARVLQVPLCELQHLDADAGLCLVAGAGWKLNRVGSREELGPTGLDALASLTRGEPAVIVDLENEPPEAGQRLLRDHGVRSGVRVLVGSRDDPWGLLGAHTTTLRDFSQDEIHFVQAAANTLATALDRERRDRELEESRQRLEQARADERLAQAERLASLGSMAGAIAHEVNNPMNNVLMNAELAVLLIEQGGEQGVVREALDQVIVGARRCGQITHSVLSLSRASGEQLGPVDIGAFLARLVEQLPLDLDVQTELAPGIWIHGTEDGLERVFENLLRNAREAGAHEVRLTHEENDHEVFVFVKDDGPGIPAAIRHRLFDPFFSTRRGEGGTGLGLSLVEEILRGQSGRIDLVECDSGACFRMTLLREHSAADPKGAVA